MKLKESREDAPIKYKFSEKEGNGCRLTKYGKDRIPNPMPKQTRSQNYPLSVMMAPGATSGNAAHKAFIFSIQNKPLKRWYAYTSWGPFLRTTERNPPSQYGTFAAHAFYHDRQ